MDANCIIVTAGASACALAPIVLRGLEDFARTGAASADARKIEYVFDSGDGFDVAGPQPGRDPSPAGE